MLKMNRNNGISYLTSAECAYKLVTQANKEKVIKVLKFAESPEYGHTYSFEIAAINTALDTEVK